MGYESCHTVNVDPRNCCTEFSERRAATWMRDLLDGEVTACIVPPEERNLLTGPLKHRRQHLKSVKRQFGKAAAKQLSQIFAAEKELARAIAATNDANSDAANAARTGTQPCFGQCDPGFNFATEIR